MSYREIIENKNVAIVGPAAYLQNSHLGKEIDSHDVVVRINRSVETTKVYGEDVGLRTDVLYSCLIEKAANAGKIKIDELVDHYKVKFLCAPPESDYSGISTETKFHYMVDKKKMKKISERLPVRIVDHGFHTKLAKHVNCRPNTGFLAIYDLLRFKPKKLSIYGFSFYLDGFIPGCKSGIEKEKKVTEEEFASMAFNSKRHVQKNMWEYAKKTLLDDNVVFLDSVLDKILNLDKLDKKLFQEAIK